MSQIKKYYNKPQLEVFLASCFEVYCEWGRGTGKSSGVIAPRIEKLAFEMPRGNFAIVAKTYQQLMTRTLPGVIKGLAELGYYQDVDYFIGSFAPKKWGWDKPFAPPVRADYFMHWRDGSGFNFISQDQKGMAAGLSLDGIIGDEAKHLNQDLYEEELLPANRGNRGEWDGTFKDRRINSSLHHSILLCSDTPTNQSGRWFIEKEENRTPEKVEKLISIELRINELKQKAIKTTSKASANEYNKQIKQLLNLSRVIRKGDPAKARRAKTKKEKEFWTPSVHFSRASALDNFDILGEEYFDQQKRNLPSFIYRTSILNERMNKIMHGFYPDLDDKVHGYDRFDNSYFTNKGYKFEDYEELDCRQDGDINQNEPLDMAPDYGGHFNCIVIGQHHGSEYRFVNAMYVKAPDKIKELVRDFKKYYRFFKRKEVNLYFDHTAKDSDAIRTTHYHEEYRNLLSKSDEYGSWKVNLVYIGHTKPYEVRYEFWSKLLKEENTEWPKFRYNRFHCEYWAISCMMAPIKPGKRGYEKDKKSERIKTDGTFATPQEEATHFSDAGDNLIMFRIGSANNKNKSVPSIGLIGR